LRYVDAALLALALMLSACWLASVIAHPERHKEQTRAPVEDDDGYVAGLPLMLHWLADR
jgi:hypothetical protein